MLDLSEHHRSELQAAVGARLFDLERRAQDSKRRFDRSGGENEFERENMDRAREQKRVLTEAATIVGLNDGSPPFPRRDGKDGSLRERATLAALSALSGARREFDAARERAASRFRKELPEASFLAAENSAVEEARRALRNAATDVGFAVRDAVIEESRSIAEGVRLEYARNGVPTETTPPLPPETLEERTRREDRADQYMERDVHDPAYIADVRGVYAYDE